jgi:hypothetical protein
MTATVVPLPVTDLKDIALHLRQLAEWIETCDEQVSCVLVLGRASQEVNVYGWGCRVSGLETQGWLARAAAHVAHAVERVQETAG